MFNKFSNIPFIPYNIVLSLATNESESANNIFKLLKYPSYDALLKPDLGFKEKVDMIWRNQDRMEDYRIFLTNIENNAISNSQTFLKCYRLDMYPKNHIVSEVCYEFDLLFAVKTSMVEHKNLPCNRADVFESELMNVLNGEEVGGVGKLQYNAQLSRLCRSRAGLGNNSTFTGVSIVMAMLTSDVREDCNEC